MEGYIRSGSEDVAPQPTSEENLNEPSTQQGPYVSLLLLPLKSEPCASQNGILSFFYVLYAQPLTL